MAVYAVYYRSPGHDAAERPGGMVLIKDGLCWPAFLFTVVWALWNRLWWVALGLVAANGAVALIPPATGLDPAGQAVISLGFMVMVGYGAAGLRGWSLERRGYALTDLVSGHGLEEAERNFLIDRPDITRTLLGGEKRDHQAPQPATQSVLGAAPAAARGAETPP